MQERSDFPRDNSSDTNNRTLHRIVIGDSRSMEEIDDESVHLVVTSPPYWQLKDYGHENQIGFDDSYEDYINNLNLVWSESHRVLHPGCRLCVNIGDQFARSVYYGRYKVIPIRTEIIRFCESIGFDSMGAIIWQKVTTTNTTGGASVMGSYPYPRNGVVKIDYEFILLFKKQGDGPKPTPDQKEASRMSDEEWNTFFAGHWNFPGERQNGHLAMFPEELPRRLIKMFTFVGETVLDPFLGSGTTSLAARNLGRNSVGFEANPQFLPNIREKVSFTGRGLFGGEPCLEIIERLERLNDLHGRRAKLPYLFHDPVKFTKKVVPRTLTFGSKVDGSEGKPEQLFLVKRVLSGNRIELDNGAVVCLIGILPKVDFDEKAREWLDRKSRGKRVFLKFSPGWECSDADFGAYVYLQDKTFLNAHLIKRGLMKPDELPHRLSERFKRYQLAAEGVREIPIG